MELEDLNETIACLSGERNLFYYFRDRYALMLLQDYIGNQAMPINTLRQSPYGKLLNKAPVKKAMSLAGDGKITATQLEMIWDENPLTFVTTLAKWGDGNKDWKWNQMSRKGYHLVLQLNMAEDHSEKLKRLINPIDLHEFNSYYHPSLSEGERGTLAWVRLDIDFETNEVLIEEIQCDWVREVREAVKYGYTYFGDCTKQEVKQYATNVLGPYEKVWEEAMLASAIHFIRHDLGIDTIYYHSFEAGAVLKNITDTKPPRSLYTKLPSRFAFEKTLEGPEFLMRDKYAQKRLKKVDKPYWFKLPHAA